MDVGQGRGAVRSEGSLEGGAPFRMMGFRMIEQTAAERALILTGRAQALEDALTMTRRVMSTIDPDAEPAVMLQQFVVGSGELLNWMMQATQEALTEGRLITDEWKR